MIEQDGKTRETAIRSEYGLRIWVDDEFLAMQGTVGGVKARLSKALRLHLARLLATGLPAEARTELGRGILGIEDNEVDAVAAHAIMLKDDPMASLLAKLETKP